MAREGIEIKAVFDKAPAALWAVAGDLAGAWHPLIDRIWLEQDARGAPIRAFTVKGEAKIYREQLTYRSESDFTFGYCHLEGIAGANLYRAELSFRAVEGGTEAVWTAEIEAEATRAKEIADGTAAIFRIGLEALREAIANPAPAPLLNDPREIRLEKQYVEGRPRLALTATPPKPGPLLLFLHGIGGGRSNWEAQLLAVGGDIRAAALDLRGYGDSALGEQQSTIDDYCNDILRVADHLKAENLILCGLSYGSWIATSFALRYPERLAGLILSGGCTGMSEASVEERQAFLKARQAPLDAGQAPADFAAGVVSILISPAGSDNTRETLRRSMAAIPARTYRDAVHCFTHPPERFDFSRLTMPVLMMTGEHDRLASPDEIRGVAHRIATSAPRAFVRFEVIKGAGHVCNVEKPEDYNQKLRTFLAEVLP